MTKKRSLLDRLARLGGLAAFCLILLLAGLLGIQVVADTLSQGTFTTGMSYSALITQLNTNVSALLATVNGKLTRVNFKTTPTGTEKLGYHQVTLRNCPTPSGSAGCVTSADLDPNTSFITADPNFGITAGFGPLRAQATATPGMTLTVGAGTYFADGAAKLYAGGTSPTLAVPGSNTRVAVLALDPNGNFSDGVTTSVWIYGETDATITSAVPPFIPEWLTPIVQVACRSTSTVIKNTDDGSACYIQRDARPIIASGNYTNSGFWPVQALWSDGFDYGSGDDYEAEWTSDTNCGLSTTEGTLLCNGSVANTELSAENTGAHTENWKHVQIRIDRGGTWVMRMRVKQPDEPDSKWFYGWAVTGAFVGGAGNYFTEYAGIIDGGAAGTFRCATDATAKSESGDLTWAATAWNVLEMRVTSSTFECYLNGKQVYTHSTAANIPSAVTLYPRFKGENGGATPQEWRMDSVATWKVPALTP